MTNPVANYSLKTLIIENDPCVRNTFELMFEEIGWSLQTVGSAEAALEAMDRQDFDIIVSDFSLPGMDGIEFFRQIGENRPASVQILTSAAGSGEMISNAYAMGLDDFLQKPFTLQTLLDTIALHARKTCRELPSADRAAA